MIIIDIIIRDEVVDFSQVNQESEFPIRFLLCKYWTRKYCAYFENGRVVIMPYLCNMANSTKMSCFRLIGAGRLWLEAGESSLGVNFSLDFLVHAYIKSVSCKYIMEFH